jgi:hypothetical protein
MNTEERLQRMEELINLLISADRYTFQKNIQIFDARNIQFGRTNGTKLGTAADQKLSFFGVVPVIQRSAIGAPAGGTVQDTNARDVINLIRQALKDIGITA